MDIRFIPAEVRAFGSHPSHHIPIGNYNLFDDLVEIQITRSRGE